MKANLNGVGAHTNGTGKHASQGSIQRIAEAITMIDPAQLKVRDIMHEGVVSCNSSINLAEAAKLMLDSKMRSLIVVDGDCGLAGIISQSDMVDARLQYGAGDQWNYMTVAEIMSSDVVTVTPEVSIKEAARILIESRIHRVVVTEHEDSCTPIGVLSMGDIMRHMMI